MNPLKTICLLMGLFALACANNNMAFSSNSIKNSMKPIDWLSPSQLESLPAMNQMSLPSLERMSLQEGADLLSKYYHLAQAAQGLEQNFVVKPNEIPAYLITRNNQKIKFKLNELPKIAKEQNQFGEQEVTIFITGMPEKTESIKKATRKLVQAYMQRYNGQAAQAQNIKYQDHSGENINKQNIKDQDHSSEEDNNNRSNMPTGNLVVIDMGSAIPTFKAYATLDIEETGAKIGNVLVQLIDEANVPQEIVHLIGSNIAAHVAGAAARQFSRQTGHQLRRVTGLDPSKIFSNKDHTLTGLARGDAEFVDVIHTSALGFGSPARNGDVDFYPNGPNAGVPGADNVVKATMRAVRYFAESVVPGNERNFPAVRASSLEEYKNQNGYGKRVYMGINTDYDVEGDFILQVNAKSPFGRSSPAQKQQNYHNIHKPWKTSSADF